ncbi:MAG TPA: collagen-like protein [Thermoleophilaceae bacterium]|nr:collagen-like protein [Thermoleophilaceae bacterium]
MSRRTLTLALIAVLALALTAPALGNGDSMLTRALGIAKSAERKANAAQRDARTAKRIARQSKRIAREKARRGPHGPRGAIGPTGSPGSTGARGPSGPAGAPGRDASVAFDQETPDVSTSSTTYVSLGGPSVEVTVPESGLIEVAAQATLRDGSDDDGAVALFEDGSPVAGQADCGPPGAMLFSLRSGSGDDFSGGTPAGSLLCATLGPPAPVRLLATPGTHTYELRYAVCCGTGSATFADRRLWVSPLP